MPPFVLTLLKVLLLALLYLFIYVAVRTIAADIYGRRPRAAGRGGGPTPRGRDVPRRIVVLDEQGKRVGSHRLDAPLQIGRSPSCQVRPPDTYLSQIHAKIWPRGDEWVVEDMGSTNGTFLNRRKVTAPTRLSPGDRIRVGKTLLEVRR